MPARTSGVTTNTFAILGPAVHDAMTDHVDFTRQTDRLKQAANKSLAVFRRFPFLFRSPDLAPGHVLKPAFEVLEPPFRTRTLMPPAISNS